MRHAQYRLELADTVQAVTIRPVAAERRPGSTTFPAVTVYWTGSTLDRQVGWMHTYQVEIVAADHSDDFDQLVADVTQAVADWRPNTSAARPAGPRVQIADVTDGDIVYPAVIVATTITEPST